MSFLIYYKINSLSNLITENIFKFPNNRSDKIFHIHYQIILAKKSYKIFIIQLYFTPKKNVHNRSRTIIRSYPSTFYPFHKNINFHCFKLFLKVLIFYYFIGVGVNKFTHFLINMIFYNFLTDKYKTDNKVFINTDWNFI